VTSPPAAPWTVIFIVVVLSGYFLILPDRLSGRPNYENHDA